MRNLVKYICTDKKYRIPRIWSNRELSKFSHLFSGKIINVGGWKDEDKEGKRYKDYFERSDEYYVSNIKGYRGFSGLDNEICLNLEKDLPKKLEERFNVVFAHTVLEHILNTEKAFNNLCKLSNDIVITVVPFVQEQHLSPDYGDYWRFTPQGVEENFRKRGFESLYLSTTSHKNSSIYIFAIASKKPEKWRRYFSDETKREGKVPWIKNSIYYQFFRFIKKVKRWINRRSF